MFCQTKSLGLFIALVIYSMHWCDTSNAENHASKPSVKRGLCVSAKENDGWHKKVEAIKASWYYTWGAKLPPNAPANIEFTPMIWGRYTPKREKVMAELAQSARRSEFKFLMGFNEPDEHRQSDMSVAEAVALWPKLEAVGVPLCSPGCVHPDRQWMKNFMLEAKQKNLRVDFISVHSYGGPSADALVSRLRKIHEMYERPLWITEFAVGDWNAKTVADNKHSPARVAKFMREVLPRLEELDFVHRYAWFSANNDSASLGTSALFNEDGSLTELGKIYSSF